MVDDVDFSESGQFVWRIDRAVWTMSNDAIIRLSASQEDGKLIGMKMRFVELDTDSDSDMDMEGI